MNSDSPASSQHSTDLCSFTRQSVCNVDEGSTSTQHSTDSCASTREGVCNVDEGLGQPTAEDTASDRSVPHMTNAQVNWCGPCQRSFPTATGFGRHMRRIHPLSKDPEQSGTLDQVFLYPLARVWTCAACQDSFGALQSLTRHHKRVHPRMHFNLVYQCSACSQEFDTGRRASNHYQIHKRGGLGSQPTSSALHSARPPGPPPCRGCSASGAHTSDGPHP